MSAASRSFILFYPKLPTPPTSKFWLRAGAQAMGVPFYVENMQSPSTEGHCRDCWFGSYEPCDYRSWGSENDCYCLHLITDTRRLLQWPKHSTHTEKLCKWRYGRHRSAQELHANAATCLFAATLIDPGPGAGRISTYQCPPLLTCRRILTRA